MSPFAFSIFLVFQNSDFQNNTPELYLTQDGGGGEFTVSGVSMNRLNISDCQNIWDNLSLDFYATPPSFYERFKSFIIYERFKSFIKESVILFIKENMVHKKLRVLLLILVFHSTACIMFEIHISELYQRLSNTFLIHVIKYGRMDL